MLTDFANLASVIRLRMYSASLVPCPMAYSSASPELSAIVPCVCWGASKKHRPGP